MTYVPLGHYHDALVDRFVPREAGRGVHDLFEWNRNLPSCVVSTSDDLTIPQNVFSTIPFNRVLHDTDGMFAPQVSPTQLTVRTPGLWMVAFTSIFNATEETWMEVRCFRNRQEEVIQATMTTLNALAGPSRCALIMLQEGEFVELDIWITAASPGSLTLIPPHLGMWLVASPGLESVA